METEIKKEQIITPDTTRKIEVDQTSGGMTPEAYDVKIGNIATLQEEVATKIAPENKGFFAKLKNAYEKKFTKTPEQQITSLKEKLEEDIKDLGYITTYDSGLGGNLGNFSGGSIWNSLVKSYGIPKEQIDTVTNMLKKAEDMNNGPEKVELMQNIKDAKKEITGMMRKNIGEKITVLEK